MISSLPTDPVLVHTQHFGDLINSNTYCFGSTDQLIVGQMIMLRTDLREVKLCRNLCYGVGNRLFYLSVTEWGQAHGVMQLRGDHGAATSIKSVPVGGRLEKP